MLSRMLSKVRSGVTLWCHSLVSLLGVTLVNYKEWMNGLNWANWANVDQLDELNELDD